MGSGQSPLHLSSRYCRWSLFWGHHLAWRCFVLLSLLAVPYRFTCFMHISDKSVSTMQQWVWTCLNHFNGNSSVKKIYYIMTINQYDRIYPLVNCHILQWKDPPFLNGKIHYFDWAIFHFWPSPVTVRGDSLPIFRCFPESMLPRPWKYSQEAWSQCCLDPESTHKKP